jgi:hypothetical protein
MEKLVGTGGKVSKLFKNKNKKIVGFLYPSSH